MTIEEINKLRDCQLTDEELLILKLNAAPNPMSYLEIGQAIGYTKQNVFHVISRAKRKIKEQRNG